MPNMNAQAGRERRSIPLSDLAEIRQDDGSPTRISWYPALFDVLSEDLGGFRERIGRRAFSKTLQGDDIRALINHDPNLILGRSSTGSLKVSADLRGLRAEVTLPETSYSADLMANINNGNISGGSFAFLATKDNWRMEDVEGAEEQVLVRTVQEARLYDVSLVAFPAYPDTEGTANLRSLAEEWREKLTKPDTREMPMCALMKAMCATCEAADCEIKAEMGKEMDSLPLNIRQRRLKLLRLKN